MHKCPIPRSHATLCSTSHFMCVQIFTQLVNIDVPASVGAPPPDTQLPVASLSHCAVFVIDQVVTHRRQRRPAYENQ